MPTAISATSGVGGFQSSEHTGVEVTVYSHANDPVTFQSFITEMKGRTQADPHNAVVSVSTTKAMGATGQWSVTLKPASSKGRDRLSAILDDDWVDIVFFQHGKPFHVMRGLVDDVRRARTVGGTGATQQSFTLTGRDFQKIWETTPMWFDRATYENVGGAATLRVVGVPVDLPPRLVVDAYIFGFLKELGGFGRANWSIPASMPGAVAIAADQAPPAAGAPRTFADMVTLSLANENPYGEALERKAVNPNFAQAGGNLWGLATEWADPLFCELFTDLKVTDNEKFGEMYVYFRTKPFPSVTLSPSGLDSPYFTLPLRIVPRQQIMGDDLGRSGLERFNDFRVGANTQQEWMNAAVDITRPLWSPNDMLRHGQRLFDVNTKYVAENNDLAGMSKQMRYLIRDWYCINPYLLNGSLNLGVGRPDIRIGERVRIPGQSEETQETFYVESVSHNWSLPGGTRTALGVTRGYVGSDASHIDTISALADEYREPPLAEPAAVEPGDGTATV